MREALRPEGVIEVPESRLLSRAFIENAPIDKAINAGTFELAEWISENIRAEIRGKVETPKEEDMASYLIYRYAFKCHQVASAYAPERIDSIREVRRKDKAAGHPPGPVFSKESFTLLRNEVASIMAGVGLDDEREVIDYLFERVNSVVTPVNAVIIPAQS